MLKWLIALPLLLVPLGAYGGDEEAADPEDPRALLAWADGLGWPDFADEPFVRVATGYFHEAARVPKNTFVHGFLLADDGKRFTILPLGNPVSGWRSPRHEYERTPEGTAEHERVGYEKPALEQVAASLLATFPRAVPQWHDEAEGIGWTPTGVLMFAKALEATGHGDLALQVVRRARFMVQGATKNLDEAGRAELAHDTMWANVRAFGNIEVSFTQLRDRFRRYLEVFPDCPDEERAEETLKILKTMVVEQTSHDARVQPLDSMSQAERVAELVFQLRTQNGQQWSQPGACSIWLDPREEESPAHRLRALGYDAVPALIEVVDDSRFTRSVGFHRDFYFSHYVLRVGDAANDVLSAITGASFYHSGTTWGAMVKDGEASEVKRNWQRWWAEFQAKGEKQAWIDSVTATGNAEHARRLLEKYPEVAPSVILPATRKFKELWPRIELLGIVGQISGEEAEALLREEMTQGPELATRLEAARMLHERGHPEALEAMLGEWKRREVHAAYGHDALIEFLVRSGDPGAIRALGDALEDRPPHVRIQVAQAFVGIAPRLREAAAEEPFTEPARSAVEAMLAARLTDTERWEGCSMSFGSASFQNPRVCDLTAFTLHQIWPDRYPAFDPDASPLQRTRHCLHAANRWRSTEGLEPLPVPASRGPEPLDDAVAAPLLQGVLGAGTPEERDAAIAVIASHGLPALPRVRAALAEQRYARVSESLLALDKRLAAIVAAVTFDPADMVTEHPVRAYAEGLKGRPLRADAFVGILTRFCSAMPPGVEGLRLGLDREGDGSGIALSLQWLKGEVDLTGPERGWDYGFSLRAGTEGLTGGSGGAAYSYKQDAEGWTDYRDHLLDALDSPPGTSIEGYVSIRFNPE